MYCVIKLWLLAVLYLMRNITLSIENASLLQLKPFIYVTYNPVMKTELIQICPRQKIVIIWLWLYIIILIKKTLCSSEVENSPILRIFVRICRNSASGHSVSAGMSYRNIAVQRRLSSPCGQVCYCMRHIKLGKNSGNVGKRTKTLASSNLAPCATALLFKKYRFLSKHLATKV